MQGYIVLHLNFSSPNRGFSGLDTRSFGIYLCLGHASEGSAGTRRLAILVVCGEVEQDEENKVRTDNDNPGKCGKFLSSTVACSRHPGKICRGKVSVRGKIDEAQVDDKLDDL